MKEILDLLEKLLSGRSQYVRDNLGPFAIGSALIRYDPREVLERLHRWSELEDEQVRWNIAMVFSAAAGASYASQTTTVLKRLAMDERVYVKRVLRRAIKTIEKRNASLELQLL